VGPLKAQGLIEPYEGIALGNTKKEWYSVNDASICIVIHIEAFLYNTLDRRRCMWGFHQSRMKMVLYFKVIN
jgi:hypothetical protein